MAADFSVGDLVRVLRRGKGISIPALVLDSKHTPDDASNGALTHQLLVRQFTREREEIWICSKNLLVFRSLKDQTRQRQIQPTKLIKDAYDEAESYVRQVTRESASDECISEEPPIIATPSEQGRIIDKQTICSPEDNPQNVRVIREENSMQQVSSCVPEASGGQSARKNRVVDAIGLLKRTAAPPIVSQQPINPENRSSSKPLNTTHSGVLPRDPKILDFALFTCHLSPLYRILHIQCTQPISEGRLSQIVTVDLPDQIFSQCLNQKVSIMIAPLSIDSTHPTAWPQSRNFSLEINGSPLQKSGFSTSWAHRKIAPQRSENLKSFMYLLADISPHVSSKSICMNIRGKPREQEAGSSPLIFRFGIFVLSLSETSKFLSKIEPLLERRKWRESSSQHTQAHQRGDDMDIVVEDRVAISLKCPISLAPIRKPVRGVFCTHAQVIDLNSFVWHMHQTKQWRCPLCALPIDTIWEIILDSGIDQFLTSQHAQGLSVSKVFLTWNGEVEAMDRKEEDERRGRNSSGRTSIASSSSQSPRSDLSNTKESAFVIE